MEINRAVQVNWGTFNVPTIISVLGILWYTATHYERQDARIEAIESSRIARSTEINTSILGLQSKVAPIENLSYRLTVVEQGVADVNRRVDRQSDSMQGIRDDIGALSTKFEVLSQKIEGILPEKRAELEKSLSETRP